MPRTPDLAGPVPPPACCGWSQFWFAPADPVVLHGVRFLFGVYLVYWLALLPMPASQWVGLHGWLDEKGMREWLAVMAEPAGADAATASIGIGMNETDPAPPAAWSLPFSLPSPTAVDGLYYVALVAAGLLTLGVATRVTSVLCWLAVSAFTSNPALAYGGNALLEIFSFYLMLGCLGSGLVHHRRRDLLGHQLGWRWSSEPSLGANLSIRLLQVHLAILVGFAGLFKLQSGDWWAGNAVWLALHRPDAMTLEQLLQHRSEVPAEAMFMVCNILTLGTLAWQISFPFLAWRPAARWWIVGGALAGAVGCVWIWQSPIYGPMYLLGSLSFLTTTWWRRWFPHATAEKVAPDE